MKIEKAQKVKVENNSPEIIKQALEKCNYAASILANWSIKDNSQMQKEIVIKALEAYSSALGINSKIPEPYLAIAEICRQFGNYNEAIGVLIYASEIIPNNKYIKTLLEKIKKESKNVGKTVSETKKPEAPRQLNTKEKATISRLFPNKLIFEKK